MQESSRSSMRRGKTAARCNPARAPANHRRSRRQRSRQLDAGTLRVAEKIDGEWVTHQWLKKAVLLSFRLQDNSLIDGGAMRYFDKVPNKFATTTASRFRAAASASCRRRRPPRLPSSARTSC
jgi:2,3,4,5-tetrahydropyridine-2-carboxylate N-succinyltransferase